MYGSQIWGSLNSGQFKQLERVNHKFMRFTAFRIGAPMKFTDHDYSPISLKLGISSVQSAAVRLDLIYLGKIFNNMVDCSSIVNGMNLNVPMRLLRGLSYSFKLLYPTDPYSFKSVTTRICNSYNLNNSLFDLFSDKMGTIRRLSCKLLEYN